ncbi:type I secretion system permease/ATPase [Aquabacterium sp.]|uniref:type I secretion system permease/ATPase n=1 Tax=Aquabacterium sp. TaxID=1872578 RepID=UPI002C43CF1D|nr:type I secretion system permease/ATPase [Aquabacterium sp.]HSW05887.1 type I secretion system permease/ATPase [Aquabacterium sp.]
MSTPQRAAAAPPSMLREALLSQRGAYTHIGWLSAVIGVLTLAPSWFMFEVYGRVLNSRNATTLLMLLLLVFVVYAVIELLDLVRNRALQRAGEAVDEQLRARVFDAAFEANLRRQPGGSVQAFNDLRTLREFFGAQPVRAVLDAPAAVLCLVLLFTLSPWLGVLALIGALIQVGLTVLTERRTMPLLTEAQQASIQATAYAGNTMRNAQVIESMGMLGQIHQRWMRIQRRFLARQAQASDYAGVNSAVAKLVQQMQGSLMLGAACWLMLQGGLWGGPGMMIVASILGARVLSPLAQLVGQWRSVVQVRDAYGRLDNLLGRLTVTPAGMPLPPPKGQLSVEGVVAGAPGSTLPIIRGVTFAVRPGEVLAVIGPSASGKSTLARLLVGVWPAASGKVRLDGADVHAWNKAELGPQLGYMPQTVELFDGTVAENIARFGRVDTAKVRAAAELVGMVDVIEALPQGFDTRIGDEGAVLSGGQRQRLGLARAVYGAPKFLVLDEPNASLDEAGEKALLQMLGVLKSQGTTVVAITHRTTLMPAVDKLLVLADGQQKFFGPRDEVMAALKKANDQMRAQAESRQAATRRPALPGGSAA